ncbi:MAG: hypothetical protein R6X12_08640 [bacterium]
MPTVKVRRADGFHCFHCNARVTEADSRCPACGREFAVPAQAPAFRPRRIGERVREAGRSRRRSYWLAVVVLAALAVVSGLVTTARGRRPMLARPSVPEPEYSLLKTTEHRLGRVERASVFARVRPGLPDDSLRAALDWLLYRVVNPRNVKASGNLRVVWAYLFESDSAPVTGWRAMAIWQEPGLSGAARPAGIGGDAVSAGDIEYDFTNELRPAPAGGEGR